MTCHLHRIAFALIAICALNVPAVAARPLTEGESLRLGLALPELAELARGRVGVAEADALEAGLWANPSLEFLRDSAHNGDNAQEDSVLLSQPVDISGRRSLKREAGEQRVAAASAEVRTLVRERAGEIRRSFYQLLLSEQRLAAIETWAGRFADTERVVGKLREAGEASGYDLRRLARERQAAEAKRAETQAERDGAREQLLALIGGDGKSWNGVAGRLLPGTPPDIDTLLSRLDERPDLAALSARAAAADLDGRAAKRGWIPEVTLGVGARRTDIGSTRITASLFSVSLPLPLFDRQQAGEGRAAAQAMGARAEYRLAHARAEGHLRGTRLRVLQLIAAAGRYRREALAPSADLVRIAESAYRAGEFTVLELLDAYRGALEAEITALELEAKARLARIELDLLTGSHAE
jgi:cobalt-zinc-cadmium efflux system outer membrane protein